MGYYLHHVPGRLRVRIPELKRRPYRIRKVREALEHHSGIEWIEHKRATGSVVVHYDPDQMDDRRILNALSYNGLYDESRLADPRYKRRRTGEKAGEAVGRIVFNMAIGRVLDANGLSFLAALI